jgi:hypothetical protein
MHRVHICSTFFTCISYLAISTSNLWTVVEDNFLRSRSEDMFPVLTPWNLVSDWAFYHTVHYSGWSCTAGQSQHTCQIVIRITLCSITHCLHSGISSIWQNYLILHQHFQHVSISIFHSVCTLTKDSLPYQVIQLHCEGFGLLNYFLPFNLILVLFYPII